MTTQVDPIDINTDTWGIGINKINELVPLVPDNFVESVNITIPTATGMVVTGGPIVSSGTFTIDYALGFTGYSVIDQVKLNGIQADATKNETDAFLRNRVNHTGTQSINTIDGLVLELSQKAANNVVTTTTTGQMTPVMLVKLNDSVSQSEIVQVARTGSYNDLTHKPTFGTMSTENAIDYYKKSEIKPVALSGSKSDVGLGNVDNTSDTQKTTSGPIKTELDKKLNVAGGTGTGGFQGQLVDWGNSNNRTIALNINAGNFQRVYNNSNFTLQAPANGIYTMIVLVSVVSGGGGSCTLSGFSKVTGSMSSVANKSWFIYITVIGGHKTANITEVN